jgi:galactokinase
MGVPALRDADLARLAATDLADRIRKRCRHVITENARVHAMASALEQRDYAAVKDAMRASHESLRDDYEVSCPELDLLVDLAYAQPGVHGARMTGGGFGGCTVNLVEHAAVDGFRHALSEGYLRHLGFLPEIYVCEAGEGAREIRG